jgi:UDP-glucose 6-dehydrogenase
VECLAEAVGDVAGKTFAALGITYKPDVDDIRESPAIEVVRRLQEAGAEVRAFDPHVAESAELARVLLVDSLDEAVKGADGVLLLVAHRAFQEIDAGGVASSMRGRLVLDACNALDRATWEVAGLEVLVLGDGTIRS